MKIMTVNLHSYIEKDYEKKLEIFTDALFRIQPDIIAMQEVNQNSSCEVFTAERDFISACFGIPLKKDNYGLRVMEALKEKGAFYNFAWLGIKKSFEVFEEGLCFLSKKPLKGKTAFLISGTNNNLNWKKRMVLGIEAGGEWFYNVHMGRWDDDEEPFLSQWEMLNEKARHGTPRWLMGDFNSPADTRNEGYDCILSSGWYDTFMLANKKDNGITAVGKIDGWRDKESFKAERIDYIFTDTKREFESSYTVFNGKNEKQISDHHAILLTYKDGDFHA